MGRSRAPRWVLVTAGVVIPFAVMLLSWWVAEAYAHVDTMTDYDTRPPSPMTPSRLVIAAVGVVVLVGGVLVWALATTARRLRAIWWGVQGLLTLGGFVAGGVWSVARLDTVDANIGGGLAVLFGLPFAGAAVVAAGCWAIWLARSGRGRALPPPKAG